MFQIKAAFHEPQATQENTPQFISLLSTHIQTSGIESLVTDKGGAGRDGGAHGNAKNSVGLEAKVQEHSLQLATSGGCVAGSPIMITAVYLIRKMYHNAISLHWEQHMR